jgi:hypothetical protein
MFVQVKVLRQSNRVRQANPRCAKSVPGVFAHPVDSEGAVASPVGPNRPSPALGGLLRLASHALQRMLRIPVRPIAFGPYLNMRPPSPDAESRGQTNPFIRSSDESLDLLRLRHVSDRASRAMAYVGMTRARDENHLAIYPAVTNEAHQHTHGSDTVIHQTRRGTKHTATQHFRTILANDDRAHTIHTVAADTDPRLLADMVAVLVDRNERRRTQRARAWRREGAQTRARQAAYQRFATARQQAAARERSRTNNYGYEREL